MKYTIKARIHRPNLYERIIKKQRHEHIVFDLIEHYQEWHDPTYGNGGGDYIDRTKVVATYNSEVEAVLARRTLNHWDGTK